MSRYFVNDPPVPVYEFDPNVVITDRAPNIIWIKARMDVETRGKVQNEMLVLGKDNKPEIRVGENGLALLIHNIVKWEGPDFDAVPLTRANIAKLDPNEPHIAAVSDAIAEHNKAAPSPNPPSDAANTSMSGGASGLTLAQRIATRSDTTTLR